MFKVVFTHRVNGAQGWLRRQSLTGELTASTYPTPERARSAMHAWLNTNNRTSVWIGDVSPVEMAAEVAA